MNGEPSRSAGEAALEGAGSLEGLSVVVTRPREQAPELAEALEARGARPVLFPTIEIAPPDDRAPLLEAARMARAFDWIVFTSVNGVGAFAEALREVGIEPGELTGEEPRVVRICAIGPATGEAAAAAGFGPDLVPDEYVAEAAVEALDRADDLEGKRILLPRSAAARDALPRGLRERGASLEVVAAYRSVHVSEKADALRRLLDAGVVDLITFTASSTVRSFHESMGRDVGAAEIAVIGPITADTARELGYEVAVVAREYTVPGLIEACERWARERPKPAP